MLGVNNVFKKICSRCVNLSYSSTKNDRWQCPYCLKDLQFERAFHIDHKINYVAISQRLEQLRGIGVYKSQMR